MYLGNEPIDLRLALIDSAQCFRWVESQGRFGAVFAGRAVWIWQENGLQTEGGGAWLRNYLDLERDYAALMAPYAEFPAAREACRTFSGMRVLRQDAWETLICFILSANNNVGRIRRLVYALSEALGEPVESRGEMLYAFPQPEALAACTESDLRAMGVGYRAPFLRETARRVLEGFPLRELSQTPYEQAHRLLTSLPGVGDKVADCVLLFGCGHDEAFPVDVWVERLTESWFHESGSRRELARRGRERFGACAGILQQYLFHAARVGAISL